MFLHVNTLIIRGAIGKVGLSYESFYALIVQCCAIDMNTNYGVSCKARNKKKRPIVVITFILEAHEFYECWGEFRAYHLLGLAVLDAPAGDCQSAVTRRDDEVAFV